MNVDFDFQDELDFFKNDRRKEAKDINAKSIVTKNKRKTITNRNYAVYDGQLFFSNVHSQF